MSMKIDSPTTAEPRHGQIAVSASASSSFSSSSPKVSMFGAKSGFVIPKNKLSGSLVPIFRGGSKVDIGSIVKEESTKQVQRKTKWGTDLTQDAAVRKGKALAYQTRVEQITQQLKSGSLEFGEDQGSDSSKQDVSADSASDLLDSKSHKVEMLELERRELIGEILRLNPSFKAPPDYKPLLKESKVPIPIKTHPGHNFIGLLLGPESNTQKRLEEETGAKVRVYGTNLDSKVEREITKSDVNEALDGYGELYVHVSGDTYEKVDAAVALIELLLTPVSDNNAKDLSSSSSVNNADVQTQDFGPSSFLIAPMPNVSQAVPAPPSLAPVQPGQLPFQPHQALWFPGTPPHVVSGPTSIFMRPILPGNPAQFPLMRAASSVPQMFTQPSNFGPIPRVPSPASLRPPLSIQPPLNQPPSVPSLQPFSAGPMGTGRPPVPVNPQIVPPIRALTPPLVSSGQPPAPVATATPGINQRTPLPSGGIARPQLPVPSPSLILGPQHNPPANVPRPPVAEFGPRSAPIFSPQPSANPPIHSSAPPPAALVPKMAPAPVLVRPPMPIPAPAQQAPAPLQHAPMPAPPPAQVPKLAQPTPMSAPSPVPPPMVPVSPSTSNTAGAAATAPKPLRPISGDFTFQPLRTQPPSVMFSAQRAPSFRPAHASPRPQQMQLQPLRNDSTLIPSGAPVRAQPPPPMSLGYPTSNLVRPVAQPTPFGLSNFPPPQSSNTLLPPNQPGGTFPVPNLQLGGKTIGFMPGNAPTTPGGSQIYDPFSPTASAAPAHQGGNPANNRKPETDAEYEDLMASVGVK